MRETPAHYRSSRAVARFLGITLAVTTLGAVIVGGMGLTAAGVGWDPPIETLVAVQIRSLPPGVSLSQAYGIVYYTGEFYGVLVQTLADVLHFVTTGDRVTLMPDVVQTFKWQGGVGITLAVIGALALGLAVYLVSRSKISALFASTLLLATPLFLGHSFINFKDLPFAVGFTLVTLGLTTIYNTRSVGGSLMAGVIGGAGLIVALGTRIGGWPLLLLAMVTVVILGILGKSREQRSSYVRRVLVSLPIAWLIGLSGLYVLNPLARLGLFRWMLDSLEITQSYPYQIWILTAGQLVDSTNTPWWYAPAWILVQLPTLTLLLVVTAAGFAVYRLSTASHRARLDSIGRAAPFLVQGLVLPLIVIALAGTLYDGIRHLLFALPGLIGLATIAVVPALLAWLRDAVGPRRFVAAGILVAIPVVSLFDSARWLPYTYAYLNPLAHLWGDEAWEVDYWGTSALAGARELRGDGLETVVVIPTNSTSLMESAQSITDLTVGIDEEFGLYQFRRAGIPFPTTECAETFEVSRDGFLIGIGGRCSGSADTTKIALLTSLSPGAPS